MPGDLLLELFALGALLLSTGLPQDAPTRATSEIMRATKKRSTLAPGGLP
jgi:hypothetical protein